MSSHDKIQEYRKLIRGNMGGLMFFLLLLVPLGAVLVALVTALAKDPQITDPMAWPMMLMMVAVLAVPIILVLWVMRARGQNIIESRAQIKALRARGEAQGGSLSIAAVADSAGALSESHVGALEVDDQVRFDFDEGGRLM